MKRKLFLACLFIAGMVPTQAQNLFKNGNFEEGLTGWASSQIEVKTGGAANGEKYIETKDYWNPSGYSYQPYIKTEYGQNIEADIAGKTYRISFWTQENTDLTQVPRLNMQLKDSDGGDIYEVQTSSGMQNRGRLLFEYSGKTNGEWKEAFVTITFPENAKELGRVGLSFRGATKGYTKIKIDNLEFVESKPIENVEVTDYQREVVVTWATATGVTSYDVKVGNATPTTVTEAKYLVTGLEPGSTTTITVSAQGFSSTEVVANTMSVTTAEAQRIPYVKFSNGVASTSFYPHLFDTNNAPTEVKVFLDGEEVTAGADGFYTLTAGDGKKLKVTFKDGTQAYELKYIVTVK